MVAVFLPLMSSMIGYWLGCPIRTAPAQGPARSVVHPVRGVQLILGVHVQIRALGQELTPHAIVVFACTLLGGSQKYTCIPVAGVNFRCRATLLALVIGWRLAQIVLEIGIDGLVRDPPWRAHWDA